MDMLFVAAGYAPSKSQSTGDVTLRRSNRFGQSHLEKDRICSARSREVKKGEWSIRIPETI